MFVPHLIPYHAVLHRESPRRNEQSSKLIEASFVHANPAISIAQMCT
jgi:hypothetical protein